MLARHHGAATWVVIPNVRDVRKLFSYVGIRTPLIVLNPDKRRRPVQEILGVQCVVQSILTTGGRNQYARHGLIRCDGFRNLHRSSPEQVGTGTRPVPTRRITSRTACRDRVPFPVVLSSRFACRSPSAASRSSCPASRPASFLS